MSGRAVRAAVGMALFVLLAGGCVQMPDSGPVVEVETDGDVAPVQGMYYVPRPPQAGESPTEIVRHFMEAMTATPIQTGVARQYLTDDAGAAWNPQRETIVFADSGNPVGSPGLASRVTVRLHGAQVLDHHGAFRGPLPRDRSAILFQLTTENGEWRITNPPNALIVPAHWFALQYQWVSLYFFDPSARTLVPEPAFVPRGDQFVASLVQARCAGPAPTTRASSAASCPRGSACRCRCPWTRPGSLRSR